MRNPLIRRSMAAFLLGAFIAGPALAKDPTTGTWKVTVTPDDSASAAGERDKTDTMTFKASTFDSELFSSRGFEAGPYEQDIRPGGMCGFTAAKSGPQGKVTWTGIVAVDQLTADVSWTKKDGTVLHYSIKGSKQ